MTIPTSKRLICKNEDGTYFVVYRFKDMDDGMTFEGMVILSTDKSRLPGQIADNWYLSEFEDYNGTVPVDGANPDD